MKKSARILLSVSLFLVFLYLVGPRFPKPELNAELPEIDVPISKIEAYVSGIDKGLPVKTDNNGLVVWADSTNKSQTEWCLLYLHGFSASRMEGAPTHEHFARHFKMNAYMPRLASHGLTEDEPLLHASPDSLYESAKEALQLAHLLGKKVVIMSTSTGGTLSLKLAADFPDLVDGLILFSPNVAINDKSAFLLSKPWGLQIARKVFGGNYRIANENPSENDLKYWNCEYRLEAIVYLQQLVDATMNSKTFSKVTCPVFMGYYYIDEDHQDGVVRVDKAREMFQKLGTDDCLKEEQAFDAGVHVIGCSMFSKCQPEVEKAVISFAEQIMEISPAK